MKLDRHIAGWFTVPAGVIRSGDDLERPVRCPVPVYVVETGSERILVDTGLHPAALADPSDHYGVPNAFGPFVPDPEAPTIAALDLSTLTLVVLTHLHFDHAGGLALVPANVPIVVQRVEWEAGHDADAVARNFFQPRDYAGFTGEREIRLVEGDHDLLGDGSIELLSTPGHTPGHQSVRVENMVIGADVVHFASALDDRRLPVFADDHGTQLRSAERLLALREDGLTVMPGHDPEVLQPGPLI